MKKKILQYTFISLLAFGTIILLDSCKTKSGCGLEEKYAPPTDKHGNLSTKRGNSTLFKPNKKKKRRK